MFGNLYDSNYRKFCLYVKISCKTSEKKRFRVWAEEYGVPNSKYADRQTHEDICVDGKVSIFLSFPRSPKQLVICVVNANNPQDKGFEVLLMEGPLKTYGIETSEQTDRFIAMAQKFSAMCGAEAASVNGRPFKNPEGDFQFRYYDVIKDRLTGAVKNTPARIGHETGIIDVAKNKFDKYTIPMRIIILLHEYSHKWRNPKMGLEISNEKGADVNALYIYLGLGYSPVDALLVFCRVFYGADTGENRSRIRLINDYIARYKKGEFATPNN